MSTRERCLIVRMYRLIKAKEFLEKFASDRSHMLKQNGEYMSPAPPWLLIQTSGFFILEMTLLIFAKSPLTIFKSSLIWDIRKKDMAVSCRRMNF